MHISIIFGDLWSDLFYGIFSWQFLQFLVAFVSFFGFVLTSAVLLILAERKVIAWAQDRYGPIHTGPWGMLQTVADMVKLLLKEDIHASQNDKLLFLIAPAVFIAAVISAFAVLPLSPYVGLPGTALATGLIYYVAMSSIDVVSVVMAGWSSNNKYALIGGLRAAAQMISYELPLILSLVGVVMLTSVLAGSSGIGTISIRDIQNYQSVGWPGQGIPFFDFVFKGFTPWSWFILIQPLMLVIYYTCGLAETNRAPFDLPEAESELVAGFLTEYSGLRWGLFQLGEYSNVIIVSAITAFLFLGGWSGPGVGYLTSLGNPGWGLLGNLLAVAYFIIKVYVLCFVFMWVRATLPRLRADQLMQFAWLILIPVTLGNILLTGLLYLIIASLGLGDFTNFVFLVVTASANWALFFGFVWLVSRVTVSSTRRAQAPSTRAQRRGPAAPVPVAGQLPERASAGASVAGGGGE